MQEMGFWDYTCPRHGSLERYTLADCDRLLDDMVAANWNSLVLGIKWLTTGYRSALPWLDQDESCTAITSNNSIIYHLLRGARQRGIRTWLLVVATIFPPGAFYPARGGDYWAGFEVFDLDFPGLQERVLALFTEIIDRFGAETDGLVVELEFCDGDAPHRIPVYNAWALANQRPDYQTIKNVFLEPRKFPFHHWRDFTTTRRIEMLREIEQTVRDCGFSGRLCSIIEIDNQPNAVLGNVNLNLLQSALPHWSVVTYDSIYDRRRNRLATMDFCIEQPRLAGLEVNYLTRGVMTFPVQPEMSPTNLETQWQMELEDARTYRPDRLWFMGSDARLDGMVCSDRRLPEWGFPDGRTARLRLLEMAREMRVTL